MPAANPNKEYGHSNTPYINITKKSSHNDY